jgi:formamidopyrimidine-DNA glycosylase
VPELPEVEHTRRMIEPVLAGALIRGVRVLRADIVGPRAGRLARATTHTTTHTPPPPPTPALARHLLDGGRIARVDRVGKVLILKADDGRALLIQLGMSGRVTIDAPTTFAAHPHQLEPHTHVEWDVVPPHAAATTAPTAAPVRMAFVDPRRFGALTPAADPIATDAALAHLGPDALLLGAPGNAPARAQVHEALGRTRRAIKPTLLDQGVLAGVGNIYADEALFQARIDPHAPAHTLAANRRERLFDAIASVLRRAVDAGGSTLRDYADPFGTKGTAQALHAVYGRGGQPCHHCGTPLASDRLGQRATVWCPRCQR